MSIPAHLFTPSFRHQRLGSFLTIIVGIMVYLASFAMATEASLSAITFTWDRGMESRMTIELPPTDEESATPQSERVKQIMALLHAMPDVKMALPVPDSETERLLKPWINQPELLKALPMPTLIDIERIPDSSLTASDVQNRLKNIAKDIRVDDHASWLADLMRLIGGLAALGALIILLTGITLIIGVNLICRAIIVTERETIALLHVVGAEDSDIARHFQYQARRLSLLPSLIGFVLALASAGLLLYFLRHFADPSSLQLMHWIGLGLMTLLVPLTAISISAFAARVSTLKLLHEMP